MYGAFRAVMLEPLPFPEPERLVPWRKMGSERAVIGLDRGDVESLRALPHLFDRIEEFGGSFATPTGGDEPERLTIPEHIRPSLSSRAGRTALRPCTLRGLRIGNAQTGPRSMAPRPTA